jgi:hypothetical protein
LCGGRNGNLLLAERGESSVGKNWISTFIKRRPEIKTKFNRKYDYNRAQCEDPVIIKEWFSLVHTVIAKYGIAENNIYNFDAAGFLMGVIAIAKVVISSETRSRPKTAQLGKRERVLIISGINSYGWTVPPFNTFSGKNRLLAWYEDCDIPRDRWSHNK